MLHLHGIGHFHPENEITNEFLCDLDIGTSAEWILERTGIRSRRTVLPLDYIRATRNRDVRAASEAAVYSNADLGARAAEIAMARAGVDRRDIGLVIAGGSVPDSATPAEACNIAAELDIEAPAFDLRSACTSFGCALHFLSLLNVPGASSSNGASPAALTGSPLSQSSSMPVASRKPYVLVVEPETVTRVVDYDDRRAAVLWGDCAVAAVLSPTEPGRAAIVHSSIASDPKGHRKVVVPWAGHFDQEGKTVQAFAIRKTARTLNGLKDRFSGPRDERRLHFIGHQANLLMLENVCRSCDIDDDRHHTNVARFGNTATAGAPSVLSSQWGRFAPGDHVAIVGVGAGLTWSETMIRFEAAA